MCPLVAIATELGLRPFSVIWGMWPKASRPSVGVLEAAKTKKRKEKREKLFIGPSPSPPDDFFGANQRQNFTVAIYLFAPLLRSRRELSEDTWIEVKFVDDSKSYDRDSVPVKSTTKSASIFFSFAPLFRSRRELSGDTWIEVEFVDFEKL